MRLPWTEPGSGLNASDLDSALPLFQPRNQYIKRQRAGKQPALGQITTACPQPAGLCRRLHSFGNRIQAQSLTKPNHQISNGSLIRLATDFLHEAPVNLQQIGRQIPQAGQGRITGAKIIYCHRMPQRRRLSSVPRITE